MSYVRYFFALLLISSSTCLLCMDLETEYVKKTGFHEYDSAFDPMNSDVSVRYMCIKFEERLSNKNLKPVSCYDLRNDIVSFASFSSPLTCLFTIEQQRELKMILFECFYKIIDDTPIRIKRYLGEDKSDLFILCDIEINKDLPAKSLASFKKGYKNLLLYYYDRNMKKYYAFTLIGVGLLVYLHFFTKNYNTIVTGVKLITAVSYTKNLWDRYSLYSSKKELFALSQYQGA